EIETFFRHFEVHVSRQRIGDFTWTRNSLLPLGRSRLFLAKCEIAFFNQALDQLIQQFFEQRAVKLAFVLSQQLADLWFAYETLVEQRLQQCAAETVERGVG